MLKRSFAAGFIHHDDHDTTFYALRAWTPLAWSDYNGNADEADLAELRGFFPAFGDVTKQIFSHKLHKFSQIKTRTLATSNKK
jgi:hypothetical protein